LLKSLRFASQSSDTYGFIYRGAYGYSTSHLCQLASTQTTLTPSLHHPTINRNRCLQANIPDSKKLLLPVSLNQFCLVVCIFPDFGNACIRDRPHLKIPLLHTHINEILPHLSADNQCAKILGII